MRYHNWIWWGVTIPIIDQNVTYGFKPCSPPSLPKPLSLKPPKGEVGSNLLKVFAQMTPAFSCSVRVKTLEPWRPTAEQRARAKEANAGLMSLAGIADGGELVDFDGSNRDDD